jgi:CBS domain-containing protein
MSNQTISNELNKKNRAAFIKHLLNDIKALEHMFDEGLLENNIFRIGAEQEFCLVDENWRPSIGAEKILLELNDHHFTTELARYNLEINLDPYILKTDSFSIVEDQLTTFLHKAKESAKKHNLFIILTGILPTISKNELEFKYMTPLPRYWSLNRMIKELRGGDFQLNIKGVDDLTLNHDSVLFEACNTSFQMHLQIPPRDFISSYNWAQTIAGPILGICANSPLLLGRELWNETRIALFQQSIDTRISSYALKNQQSRVSFGNSWEKGSIAEIFKNDIAQHNVILSKEIENDSLEELKIGSIPSLSALNLHNSTIYKWNRPCYGITDGKPHIRIENRYIGSGPTILDEMATFAFWVGLMIGRPEKYDDMPSVMDFRIAKENFIKTARTGKYSVINWMGKYYSVKDLILKELLPVAYSGLQKANINPIDIEKYMKIIEERANGITGSQWIINNYRKLRKTMKKDDALRILTKAIHDNQEKGEVVNLWDEIKDENPVLSSANLVGHIMSTQLFTVSKNDLANLATSIMNWKNIHHVPVVKKSRELCGLLTWKHIKKYQSTLEKEKLQTVAEIMIEDVVTVEPNNTIKEAIQIMKKHDFGCLPVLKGKELVGIITVKDVIPFDNDNTSK